MQILIERYLDHLRNVQQTFSQAINSCLDGDARDDFKILADETHRFESKADDVREEIKTLMYSKVLLPESRGDIMGLLESIDQVPRFFEIILNIIRTQKLAIPDLIVSDVRELVSVSMEACDLMIMQVEDLLQRARNSSMSSMRRRASATSSSGRSSSLSSIPISILSLRSRSRNWWSFWVRSPTRPTACQNGLTS